MAETYKKLTYDSKKIQVDSAVRDGNGAQIDTTYLKKTEGVTQVKVGTTAYNPSSGVISLPAYPTMPTVNNGTLTIQGKGTSVATFTANQSGNTTLNIAEGTGITITNDTSATTKKITIASNVQGNVQADWNATSGLAVVLNKPTKLSQFTNDVVNNGTLTIKQNGTSMGTFTANQSGNTTIELTNSTYTVNNGTLTIKQGGTSKGTFTANQSGNTTIELTDNNTTYSAGYGLLLSSTTFAKRASVVGHSGNNLTNYWYKVASISHSYSHTDYNISWKVWCGYSDSSTRMGTLTAHLRTNNTGFEGCQLVWENAQSGIDPTHFVILHNAGGSFPCTCEIWAYCNTSWQEYHFDILGEGTRSGFANVWTLYNNVTDTAIAGEVGTAYTSGLTKQDSTLGTLKNNISGSAGSVAWGNVTSKPFASFGDTIGVTNNVANVKLGYSASGKNYAIAKDSSGNLYVNVPWTDNNTWTAMVGATSSANGSVGYVNAVPPKDGYNTKFLRADGTWAVPSYIADTDCKTSSANKASTKLFLIGAETQSTNNTTGATTQSNVNCYIGTDNCLYSNGSKVLTSYTNTQDTCGASNSTAKLFLVGRTAQSTGVSNSNSAVYATNGELHANYVRLPSGYDVGASTNTQFGGLRCYADDTNAYGSAVLSAHGTVDSTNYYTNVDVKAGTSAKVCQVTVTAQVGSTLSKLVGITQTGFLADCVGTIASAHYYKGNYELNAVSFTRSLTSGTKVGTITIDGTATDIYCNTGTVTSVKVGSTSYSPSSGVVSLPAYPTVNNATLTIQKNGTNVNTFTANASSNVTANITVPTKVSELTNDSGFITTWTTVNNGTFNIQGDGATVQSFTANASGTTNMNFVSGTGISLARDTTNKKITVNHSNSITAGTAGQSTATSGATLAVPYVTYDAQGHVTAKGTHTHSVTALVIGGSATNTTLPTASSVQLYKGAINGSASTVVWLIETYLSGNYGFQRATSLADASEICVRTRNNSTSWGTWTYSYAVWKA